MTRHCWCEEIPRQSADDAGEQAWRRVPNPFCPSHDDDPALIMEMSDLVEQVYGFVLDEDGHWVGVDE